MLIELSISNYLSFREKQTFSMAAAPRLRKKENVFKLDVKGEKLPDLLKIAAIYGPNASGKSNLIKALELTRDIASRRPSAQLSPLPIKPFRFDPLLANQPSRIELHFVCEGQRYEFQWAATAERIMEERLVAFPMGKETLMYNRHYAAGKDEYIFGKLEGGRDLRQTWQRLTGSQSFFIAQAVANSSESLQQLRRPFNWLLYGVSVVHNDMRGWAQASQDLAKDIPEYAKRLCLFLQEFDVPITDIRFDSVVSSTDHSTDEIISETDPITPSAVTSSAKSKTTLMHETALGRALFEFNEESEGTKNLIGFWLPWLVNSEASENLTRTLVVDELDSSLHPKIVACLIENHLKSKQRAQLIFTTHDTHLMDTKLLRRDQFWLTERDKNGATQLRSIHDFDGRENEDLEKRYYEGRYRGLPLLRKA